MFSLVPTIIWRGFVYITTPRKLYVVLHALQPFVSISRHDEVEFIGARKYYAKFNP